VESTHEQGDDSEATGGEWSVESTHEQGGDSEATGGEWSVESTHQKGLPGVVVVGTGFGCRVHVPALRNAGFDVVALVGQDEARTQRRAERAGIPNACASLTVALALGGIDAVTIATPPDTHAVLAIEACAAGKHVICEKPFALDAPEALRMLDAAQAAGVTHLVGHEFRWAVDRALVARVISSGAIGEARCFSLVQYVPLVADPDTRMPAWWFDAERGGGWLGAAGSHVVDQLRTWLGDVAAVSAVLPTVSARSAGAEDSFVVRVEMRNGAHGIIQQTAASWAPHVVNMSVVAGTKGTLEIAAETVFLSDRAGRRAVDVPSDLALPAPVQPSDDPRARYTHLELGPYTRLCEVLRAGIEGRPAETRVAIPTFADGLAEMQVLDAIRASAAAGGAYQRVS
jgi:predicted dehydrogenase